KYHLCIRRTEQKRGKRRKNSPPKSASAANAYSCKKDSLAVVLGIIRSAHSAKTLEACCPLILAIVVPRPLPVSLPCDTSCCFAHAHFLQLIGPYCFTSKSKLAYKPYFCYDATHKKEARLAPADDAVARMAQSWDLLSKVVM